MSTSSEEWLVNLYMNRNVITRSSSSERASAAARSAASASEHSCNVRVCTYVDTMYTFNLYMYQKSFEVPTMWSHARKRKYYLVHPVTQAQVSEV